jgi:MoaA/NifB/PqqE/SkfB family radical SAM enzyme
MDLGHLAGLAYRRSVSAMAEQLYMRTGIDKTTPISFYAIFNERCNVACRYCEYWRLKEYQDEMSVDEWKRGLASIKEFMGNFVISFSGGEPFIKPGLTDLMAWCSESGIQASVTTNGSALTERNAAKAVAARPFNMNISVDAPNAEIHDYLRGYPGLFDKLSKGIGHLLAEQEKQGIKFPIGIKPTVGAKNFRLLPEMVEWAQKMGASYVSFQPMDRWTPETYNELWIEEPDWPELQAVVDRLIEMSRNGAPIMTPPHVLELFPAHFRGESAPRDALPCRVGMRNFFIRTNGNVELCQQGFGVVGNIKNQSAKEIWYSDDAKDVRKRTTECEKLCLITCLSQKTFGDQVKMGTRLLLSGRHSNTVRLPAEVG